MPKRRIKKPARGISRTMLAPSDNDWRRMEAAITELDQVVVAAEKRWGVDRLPELVSVETQERFWKQFERLDGAIRSDDCDAVVRGSSAMIRAYKVLEDEARDRGHCELAGTWYEAPMDDGRVLIVAETVADAHKASRERDGALVYSMDEVARLLIASEDARNFAKKTKEVFPGATVEDVRSTKPDNMDDPIPF